MAKTIINSGSFAKKKSTSESGLPDDVIKAMEEIALNNVTDWLEIKSDDYKVYLALKSYDVGDDTPFDFIVYQLSYNNKMNLKKITRIPTVKNIPSESWRNIV